MRLRHPGLFLYGPWILVGSLAVFALPIAWALNPRTQNRDGSDPRPLRDNGGWTLILVGLAIGGLILVVAFGRAWARAARNTQHTISDD